jgi:hypothetical protein
MPEPILLAKAKGEIHLLPQFANRPASQHTIVLPAW